MACTKIRFNKKEVQGALNTLRNKGRQYRKEKRYYQCDECGAWHLTSMDAQHQDPKPVKLAFRDKWKELLQNK